MANVDAPKGLIPIKHLDGSPYNGMANLYYVPATDATALFVGDAVKSAGSADANGIPTVTAAAAGDPMRGVVVGISPETDEGLNYKAASTAAYVLVADAPDLVFEVQEDSVGGAVAAASVGLNADLVVAAGSTLGGGSSRMELDSSSVTALTAGVRILRLRQTPNNAIGDNAKWEVMINEHELKGVIGV